MVSSAKMLLKTATPSLGQPTPVKGWQFGDEYFRSPTSVTPLGPTDVPAGMHVLPVALYGKVRPLHEVGGVPGGAVYAGMTVPGWMKYSESDPNGPHDVGVPPRAGGALRTLPAGRLFRP